MPFVDDALEGLKIQIDIFWYNILVMLAQVQWGVMRSFIMMGYTIELLNDWLVEHAFAPLIEQTNASLQAAVGLSFAIALLVLGITYLLASFVRLNVVEPRSAIQWYLAGALFFTLGPSLYASMSDFRREVSQAFYASTLTGLQNASGSTFTTLSSVDTDQLSMFTPCDNLGVYLPGVMGPQSVDGLDVALAYLRADGLDVMGYLPPVADLTCPPHLPDPVTGLYTASSLPWEWRLPGSFFDNTRSSDLFPALTDEERSEGIAGAVASQERLLTAWPLVLFGLCEQMVYLLLTIAQGITFVSFGAAVLFAFFKKTEVIARSIVDQWIELIIQTVIIALVQSLVVAFFLAGTASGKGMVVLGIGLICLVFMVVVLWSGIKAVWNSFNRLFNAFGQAADGTMMSPGTAAALTAAGGAAVAAGSASLMAGSSSMGSNTLAGMTALYQGATPAQAAGLTFGGSQALSGAARTMAYLPSLRNTALGEASEQFAEGSVARQVGLHLPFVGKSAGAVAGAMLLSDRHPDHAIRNEEGYILSRPMLVPAVGEALSGWTVPHGAKRNDLSVHSQNAYVETDEGEWLVEEHL